MPSDPPIPLNAEQRRIAAMLVRLARTLREQVINPTGKTDQAKSWHASQAAARIASIERELRAFNVELSKRTIASLQPRFDKGLADANQQLREAGVLADGDPLKGSFALVDSRRAQALVRTTADDVAKAAKSTVAETRKLVRQIHAVGLSDKEIKTIIAGGTISGTPKAALDAIRKKCQAVADKDGKLWVVNKNGEAMAFDPKNYADIVYQTASAEAANIATLERLGSKGIRYVKIIGSNSTNFCTAFVGKVYWTGDGNDPLGLYPRLDVLPHGGAPFHPRCTKRYVAFFPAQATPAETDAAKPDEQTKQLHGKDIFEAQKTFEKQASTSATGPVPPTVAKSSPATPTPPPPEQVTTFPPAIQQAADEAAKTMTADEIGASSRYQSKGPKRDAGYQDVNAFHRFGSKPKRGQEWVDRVTAGLDSAIAKSTIPEPIKTYRAIRGNSDLIEQWTLAAATQIPWTEKGFFSTSASPLVAPEFWAKNSARFVFEVELPAGTRALIPSAVTGRLEEQLELILGRGRLFLINLIDESGDIIRVKATVLE
jgi:hypothetical protein